MTKSSNGTEKTPGSARPSGSNGGYVEKRGYAGAITTEKLPKAPPLVSGQAPLASATPSSNGAKKEQG
jgi:hypothetical protein